MRAWAGPIGFAVFLALVAGPRVAHAKGHPKGIGCIDSYGTVIDGVDSPSDCKKLGARWGKPGTKSLPKDTTEKSAGSSRHGKKHKVASE
ncbi:MAG: hypothetical protein JST54_34835 [Deltaproteobacteria bacterium]|nr:hypothetical protein [Deltaproteobacteria bacterium]